MISSDLLASFAACLRLSPRSYLDCVFLGFALYVAEPGFGPHNTTKSLWTIFQKWFLHFRSNSPNTWPSKVIPFIQALTMFTWSSGPPEGPLSDAKRTEFAISDMMVIALTTKFWEEYKLVWLDMTKEALFWNWWQDSVSGFSFGGFKTTRFLGCWFSFIIFCSLVLSADESKYAWLFFSAKSSLIAGALCLLYTQVFVNLVQYLPAHF